MSIVSLKGSAKLCSIVIARAAGARPFKILALDLGTHCGWAVGTSCSPVESGVQTFELKRGESPGMRFLRFNKWLSEMLLIVTPDMVVYETVFACRGPALEVLLGMYTRIQEHCAIDNIAYAGINASTLKKRAAGSGRASKEEMIKVASESTGRIITDDNEADAICLLQVALVDYAP
jgi:Holliday junction resolvasome RuvABC endonuclease subunit